VIEISARLYSIAKLIPAGLRVADIGSDHAYLPTYLVQTGKSPFVVAGEVNEGPYNAAKKQIEEAGLQKYVQVRKGDGLSVLREGEADVIVIAGMGGGLITQILQEGRDKLKKAKQLVLQPNVGEELVRSFALEHGWQLIAEEMVEEDDHIYEILSFVQGDGHLPYRQQIYPFHLLLKMGPYLLQQQGPIFRKKWQRELKKMENILAQLAKSANPSAMEKRERLRKEYEEIKEVIR
jgi:tRNA (adenine22-N1)-methyltransferase